MPDQTAAGDPKRLITAYLQAAADERDLYRAPEVRQAAADSMAWLEAVIARGLAPVPLVEIRLAIRQGLMAYPNHLSEGMDAAAVAVARLLDQRAAGESQASEPADLLRRAAAGRRQYTEAIRNVPAFEHVVELLDLQADTLAAAARVVEGDLQPLYNWLPSWQWTPEMEARLYTKISEPAAPKLAQGAGERPIDLDDRAPRPGADQ